MKKILSLFCAAAIIFTTVAIGISATAEVVPPANQDPAIATTIVCSSKPTEILNFNTNAQRRSIASISKITTNESMRALGFKTYRGFGSTMDSTNPVAAFDFPAGAVTNANGGYIFYLDLPILNSYADVNVPIEHVIGVQRHLSTGAVDSHTQKLVGKNDTVSWYVLRDGETEWEAMNEWRCENYGIKIGDGTEPFRGYVYVPTTLFEKGGLTDASGREIAAISVTVDVDRQTYAGDAGRGSERGVAPMDVSAVTLVSSFNSASTLIYNDYGQIVDLAATEDEIGEENTDNVKLAYWVDGNGDEIELWPGMDVPSNITTDANWSLVENTTKLPLTSLFKYTQPESGKSGAAAYNLGEEINPNEYAAAIFYVEVPDFGTVKNQTAGAETPDDASDDVFEETDQWRFAINFSGYNYLRDTDDLDGDGDTTEYLYNEDGSIKTGSNGFYQYAGQDWFIRGVNDTAWKSSGSKTFYGISLKSGWKGYVLVELNGLKQNLYGGVTEDARINSFNLRQLRSTTDVLSGGKAYYAYLPAGESVVLSAPIWVKGDFAAGASHIYTANPELVIDDVAYDIRTGKAVDYSSNPTNFSFAKAFKTYQSTREAISGGTYGHRNLVASTSILTSELGLWTTAVRTYDESSPGVNAPGRGTWPEGTLFSELTSSTKSGFIFYLEMPKQDEGIVNRFTVNIYGTKSDGTGPNERSLDVNVGGTQVVYLLKDGASAWETRTEGVAGEWYNNYYPIVNDGSEAWSGYVFVPKDCMNNWGTGVYNLQEVRVTTMNGRYTNKSPNTQDKTLGVSAVSMVNGFDATSTICYGDDNRIVNLATDEILDLDYFSAKEFIGKEELLPEVPSNVIKADTMALRECPIVGNAVASTVFTGGTVSAGATYVKSESPITKMPMFSVSGTVGNVNTSQGIQMDISGSAATSQGIINCDDIDGFMFYVKNSDVAVPIRFGAATTISSDGVTYTVKYSQYNSSATYLLAKGGNAWTTAGNEGLSGMRLIPANFEGWVYIPKFGNMTSQYTKCWRINIYMGTTSEANTVDFDFGSFMTVQAGTFTTDNAGYALVNGAAAVQNMWTGDFAVIDDYTKDMKVNLLDLAKAKAEANAETTKAFKDNYLSEYFKIEKKVETPIPVISNVDLAPLTASDYKLLSDNPDRGYRTEMVIGLQEKHDEGETRDARNLYTSGTEAEIRETMNQIFEIYFPTNAEHHSKLVLAFISFKDWNKSEYLPEEVLKVLEIYFEYCRKYEIRVLVRFSYGVPTNLYIANAADREKLEKVCADEATMIRHIKQLAPFIAKHRDVVHKISSGWIGNGEMVASFQWPAVNFDNVIRAVVEEMCVPNDLYFTVRLPRYAVDMLNNYKAETGKDYPYADIIGYNNDGIYGEQNNADMHSGCYQYNHVQCGKNCFKTQSNYFDEWQYVIKNAAYTPQSGEMFTNEGLVERDVVPKGFEVMLEMAHHRYNTFSQWHGYQETTVNRIFEKWMSEENYSVSDMEGFGIIYDPNAFVDSEGNAITQNPYEYMRDHLGYKLVAENTSFNWSGKADEAAVVSMSFKNYGFAAPFTLESGFAILDENYNVVSKVAAGDPDKWYSLHPDYYTDDYAKTGSIQDDILTYSVDASLKMPEKTGKYYVAFYLQNDLGEGARLSNDIVFEKEFNILHEITVK